MSNDVGEGKRRSSDRKKHLSKSRVIKSCADPEGGQGVRTPWKITKIYVFSKTGPDPLENHKTTKPAFTGPLVKRHFK